MADPDNLPIGSKPSLVWPCDPADPNGATSLTVADLVSGGGLALRSYVTGRLDVVDAAKPGTAKAWSQFALDHLADGVGDCVDGGVKVAAASLQMVLAYVAHLERRVGLDRSQAGAA